MSASRLAALNGLSTPSGDTARGSRQGDRATRPPHALSKGGRRPVPGHADRGPGAARPCRATARADGPQTVLRPASVSPTASTPRRRPNRVHDEVDVGGPSSHEWEPAVLGGEAQVRSHGEIMGLDGQQRGSAAPPEKFCEDHGVVVLEVNVHEFQLAVLLDEPGRGQQSRR